MTQPMRSTTCPIRAALASAVLTSAVLASAVLAITPALAAEPVRLTLKDHRFAPAEAAAPTGERFRIEVTNQDPTPAEFESRDLRVEKIIAPGGTISVLAGPLKPGAYKFFDDYHPDTAAGTLTAVERQARE